MSTSTAGRASRILKWIYHLPLPADLDLAIEQGIDVFLRGAPTVMRECIAAAPRAARRATSSKRGIEPGFAAFPRLGFPAFPGYPV